MSENNLIIQLDPAYHLGLDQVGYATFVVGIFFVLLAILAVGLRLYTRRLLRNKIGIDDWLIIAALVVFFGFTANALICVFTYGGGQQYEDEAEALTKYVQYMKAEYIVSPLYATNVTLIKMSILPADKDDSGTASFPAEANGIAGDFPLLFLVHHSLFPVNLEILLLIVFSPPPKRVIITGTVRIFYIYVPGNENVDLNKAGLWSVINMGVSILCACLPTYRPLLSKLSPGPIWKSLCSYRSRKSGTDSSTANLTSNNSKGNNRSNKKRHSNYYRMDGLTVDCLPLAEVVAEERRLEAMEGSNGIRVQRDFEVV
ncbi:hypothetical protein UA08_02875 [Talaromyces atroroseus]|uniref:Rhodopsin domain-containing protein n=1 Tax=Talaromyces atroroseus TaxID=1441469 RepID=A0A225ALM4_TALAT|nr:hypothetical protein UA08_02875 [Talaromyces atroroseus]OKL61810.1 hypothetical protein UA08_02875 [Talaromyces atroroseus]